MRLALLGYFGFGNAGDEALLAAQVSMLREVAGDPEFRVISGDVEQTAAVHGLSAVPRDDPRALAGVLRWCDALVTGSGSLLQDVTSARPIAYYGGLMIAARGLGKVSVCYAQGLGPISRRGNELLAGLAMRSCQQVSVRDEASARLVQAWGVADPIVVADPVLGLPLLPDPDEQSARRPGRKRLAVALRPWPGFEGVERALVDLLAAVAESADLLFVPLHEGQDVDLAVRLAGELPSGAAVRVVEHDGGYLRSIAALQRADAVLGMRLHSLVAGAGRGVPVVPISYDPKVDAFAASVGVGVPLGIGPRGVRGSVEATRDAVRAALDPHPSWLAEYRRRVAVLAATARIPAAALVRVLGA